jgi:propionyl-CoA synthetase
VAKLAGVLTMLGVTVGDTIIIYMPMIPEAIFAMLACARVGATHSVVFGGFAPRELASRISDCKPKVIFSASCGIEPSRIVDYKQILDESFKLSNSTAKSIIVQRS